MTARSPGLRTNPDLFTPEPKSQVDWKNKLQQDDLNLAAYLHPNVLKHWSAQDSAVNPMVEKTVAFTPIQLPPKNDPSRQERKFNVNKTKKTIHYSVSVLIRKEEKFLGNEPSFRPLLFP